MNRLFQVEFLDQGSEVVGAAQGRLAESGSGPASSNVPFNGSFYLSSYLWLKILLSIVAGYLIVELVLLPPSIAFGGILSMRPLRALTFVFFNYISIGIAFGVLYVTLCCSSFNIGPGLIDLAYFSFSTMTTLGIGGYCSGKIHHIS